MSEYVITESDNIQDLELQVNRYIAAGFVPLGGVAVALSQTTSIGSSQQVYAQALAAGEKGDE